MGIEKKIIVVNGTAGAGKDTFVDFCIDQLANLEIFATKLSSVDQVKEAAFTLGWNGIKDEKGRQFLSDLKDLSTQAYDGPMRYMFNKISKSGASVFFVFIREPEEIKKFVKETRATTILIKRSDAVFNNHADRNVEAYAYDFIIYNKVSIYDLKAMAKKFVKKVVKV